MTVMSGLSGGASDDDVDITESSTGKVVEVMTMMIV